jgi:tRNA pseudouridine38-40 synthase
LQRYKLTIEYDGSSFAGWQRQAGAPSVQERLEAAAAGLDQRPVTAIAAGRTDAGVHALGQVAHVDLDTARPADKVRDALNAHLRPDPVAVLSCEAVGEDFHARFSATRRRYLYRIINRRPDLALDRDRAWRVPVRLDPEAMREAALHLQGRHDFSTFRDSQCQAESPVRTLDEVSVEAAGEEIRLWFSARSFLHRQVRSMVGSLAEVGRGRRPPRWIADILAAGDRTLCGPIAPAHGLYLQSVAYERALLTETDSPPDC